MVKRTTNQMHDLDIRRVHRAGNLTPGVYSGWSWKWLLGNVSSISLYAGGGGVTLSYSITNREGQRQEYRYRVGIEWTPCNYGGQRPWWTCPECGRRVAILFGGRKYACRHCHDLTYKSTRTSPDFKHYARASKVRMRLGWGGGVASPMGDKPKGMHWKTYLRLLNELNGHGIKALGTTKKMLGQINGVVDRTRVARASFREKRR
jgi:hypothetical protein